MNLAWRTASHAVPAAFFRALGMIYSVLRDKVMTVGHQDMWYMSILVVESTWHLNL
jgi:hypothetical protein